MQNGRLGSVNRGLLCAEDAKNRVERQNEPQRVIQQGEGVMLGGFGGGSMETIFAAGV